MHPNTEQHPLQPTAATAAGGCITAATAASRAATAAATAAAAAAAAAFPWLQTLCAASAGCHIKGYTQRCDRVPGHTIHTHLIHCQVSSEVQALQVLLELQLEGVSLH
jgi:hypothetical protein